MLNAVPLPCWPRPSSSRPAAPPTRRRRRTTSPSTSSRSTAPAARRAPRPWRCPRTTRRSPSPTATTWPRSASAREPTDFRKNCQLNLRVNVPQGFTYGIAQADYRGFAHLERGAYAIQKANYYFQGMSQNDSARTGTTARTATTGRRPTRPRSPRSSTRRAARSGTSTSTPSSASTRARPTRPRRRASCRWTRRTVPSTRRTSSPGRPARKPLSRAVTTARAHARVR